MYASSPRGNAESSPHQPGRGPSDDAWLGDGSAWFEPPEHGAARFDQFGYEHAAYPQRAHDSLTPQPPEYGEPPQRWASAPSADPGGSAYGVQAYSGVSNGYHQPAGYRPSGYGPSRYGPSGYQPLGAADTVSYGYDAVPSYGGYGQQTGVGYGEQTGAGFGQRTGAGYGQHGGSLTVDGASVLPGWTGEPEPDHPEFTLHAPQEPEPRAQAARFIKGTPHRAPRRRRRRGVWLGFGVVLVTVMVAAAAVVITGRLGRSGRTTQPTAAPSHLLATPQRIGPYARDQQEERQLGLSHGEQYLTQIDPGHVSGIVAAVYDVGGPVISPDQVAVIAGRLVNSPVADVIKSFKQQETTEGNAPVTVPAGPLGGRAACAGNGTSGICVWADADSVGILVSATINARSLARVMLTIRSGTEIPAT